MANSFSKPFRIFVENLFANSFLLMSILNVSYNVCVCVCVCVCVFYVLYFTLYKKKDACLKNSKLINWFNGLNVIPNISWIAYLSSK